MITKVLVFVPIALAVFYFDLPGLQSTLLSGSAMSVILVALSIFAYGLFLKRKIVSASLDISKPSYVWGTVLLGAFLVAYLYGSYSASTGWLHFQSFCFILLSYVAYRIGTKVIKAMLPLVLVILLLPVSFDSFSVGTASLPVPLVLTALEALLLFSVYVGFRLRPLFIITGVLALGFLGWYHPVLANQFSVEIHSWYFVPVPMLFLVSSRLRKFSSLPPPVLPPRCLEHRVMQSGFCTVCGRKVRPSSFHAGLGSWGLATILGLVAILLVASAPVLALKQNSPYDSVYTSRGPSESITLATPAGWETNSTKYYNFTSDSFAIERVYVPVIHPEVKNYTMYYELSSNTPVSAAPSGGEIPGLVRLWNNNTQLGALRGYLTAYQTSGALMLVYNGKTGMIFLDNGVFVNYIVGVDFVREFKNTNLASDVNQFMGDLNSIWVPLINNDYYYSNWTWFLSTLDSGFQFVLPFILITASALVMVWVARSAGIRDRKLDEFLTRGSRLGENGWNNFSAILAAPKMSGTGYELVRNAYDPDQQKEGSLIGLRQAGIIEQRIVERGDELVLTWRASV